MHKFFLAPEHCRGGVLTLPEREAHHATHVLRLGIGEKIIVLDGAGQTIEAEISEVSKKALRAAVISRHHTPPRVCRVTLAQAIPKGKLMDAIVQKTVELGVSRIVPLLSERVVRQFDDEGKAGKEERWTQTAVEALKQCGSPWLPQVSRPLTLAEFLQETAKPEFALIGSLRPDARHPRRFFEEFVAKNGRPPATACLWIGPEGDFTAAETEAAQRHGAFPVSLGSLVLRCETAAVSCLANFNYEIQCWTEAQKGR